MVVGVPKEIKTDEARAQDPGLKKGLNVYDGRITYRAVAEAFGMDWTEVEA